MCRDSDDDILSQPEDDECNIKIAKSVLSVDVQMVHTMFRHDRLINSSKHTLSLIEI